MKPTRTAVVLAAAFVLVAAACGGKKEGGKCKGGESVCMDKTAALTCQGDKFIKVACNGPMGCTKFENQAKCDDSIASPGDACMGASDEEYACTPDKKRALVCKGGRFERLLECRGKGGCTQVGQQISCDTSIAVKGDPCKSQDAVSCSEDGKELVKCRDGKFVTHRFCRGPKGCQLREDVPQCDETLSLDGDPCSHPGRVVCSVDGEVELTCQGSVFLRSRTCRKKPCKVVNRPGGGVECD